MKDLLSKISLKQKILIGIGIIAIIVIIFAIIVMHNSPNKTIKKYCDIMVKGNYEDMLDIAYFPNSEFITKEKIEEAKKQYFEKMQQSNNDVVSCTYSQANEDDEKIYYKLTINGNTTENMEIDKKTNKILIDGLYETKQITTYSECLVTIDGKEITNPTKENNKEIYETILLSNVEYDIKIKPKKGINDDILNEQIKKESEDGSKITLADRNTDLENGTDTLTFSREYDDGILSIKGSFDIIYNFIKDSWVYDKKENENYEKKWNISGTWQDDASAILELTEKEGNVTGTFKDVTIFLATNHEYNGVYNSGTLSDDGSIEIKGSMTSVFDFGEPEVEDSILKGTINSKEKTIEISISGFLGNWELTKK